MALNADLFIDCKCDLGEGPFWHPTRKELFWFDINVGKLFRANSQGEILDTYKFDEPVSAAALVDNDNLLIASASGILKFSIHNGKHSVLAPLEANIPSTRSNDARVNMQGAWWIGTMARNESGNVGSVYWFRDGMLDPIQDNVRIPNATCFSPDGKYAYFADTPTRQIKRVALDTDTGKPTGQWEIFVDLTAEGISPDGAVVDSAGCLWNAEYGRGRVTRYTPEGKRDLEISVPAKATTCPAFGGNDLKTLYITTASQGLSPEERAAQPHAGSLFAIDVDVAGLPETAVRYSV